MLIRDLLLELVAQCVPSRLALNFLPAESKARECADVRQRPVLLRVGQDFLRGQFALGGIGKKL